MLVYSDIHRLDNGWLRCQINAHPKYCIWLAILHSFSACIVRSTSHLLVDGVGILNTPDGMVQSPPELPGTRPQLTSLLERGTWSIPVAMLSQARAVTMHASNRYSSPAFSSSQYLLMAGWSLSISAFHRWQ